MLLGQGTGLPAASRWWAGSWLHPSATPLVLGTGISGVLSWAHAAVGDDLEDVSSIQMLEALLCDPPGTGAAGGLPLQALYGWPRAPPGGPHCSRMYVTGPPGSSLTRRSSRSCSALLDGFSAQGPLRRSSILTARWLLLSRRTLVRSSLQSSEDRIFLLSIQPSSSAISRRTSRGDRRLSRRARPAQLGKASGTEPAGHSVLRLPGATGLVTLCNIKAGKMV